MAIDCNSSSSAAAATPTATTNPVQRAPPRPTTTTTTTISPQTQHIPRLPPELFAANIRPLPPHRNYIPASASVSAPPQGIPYPVVSSGRGFISLPKSSSSSPAAGADQTVTVASPNPSGYRPRPAANYVVRPIQHIHHYHHHQQQPHLVAGPVKGVPVSIQLQPKVPPSPSVPDCNGYKDMRDKVRDDSLTIVRDRKVRITEDASLYALCQSWLRNGFSEESQKQYGDAVMSLPRPLPIPMATNNEQKKEGEEDDNDGDEEDEESVKNLSAEDLFKRHLKRAKKVRARLREVRQKRIARYKSRLALLLGEQFRNDVASGT
ncbi:lysine-rich arabinogalactan protein 19 [Morus notabilis]|uniref:lysine-rich arabinogalactan protein 19 n=1 Tax=Morus notabilis TaxID=981085 RepID=UPI000CED63F5|nr:lysine-rich arabinogalactan protein 19 [Morus notabilis]